MLHLERNTAFGFPYHGLANNGILSIRNGTQIPYPGISNGDTQLVKVPGLPAVYRTPEQQASDLANGFEWRNYALVTDNRLGHVNLNDPLYQWIIYIDDNKVPWHLRFGLVLTSFQQARMWCEVFRPFGRIAKTHPMSRLPTLITQTAIINGFFLHANRFTLERNSRGCEVLIHLYANAANSPGINSVIDFPKEGTFQSPWGLYEVWKLKVQGNGLLTEDENRLGEGITATLERYLSFSDIQKRVIINIPRAEVSLRVNHIEFDSQQSASLPIPPNCGGVKVTFNENWQHDLTPIDTQSAGGYFFQNEQVVHKVWGWNGIDVSNTNIVRMLFDKDDNAHKISVCKRAQSLNKKSVLVSGEGSQNIVDATYQLNSGMCKQQPSSYNRMLNLTTNIIQESKIVENTEILVNDIVAKELHLEETRTHSETQIRTISESGIYYPGNFTPFQANDYDEHTDSSSDSSIVINHGDKIVRNFKGSSSEIPITPFSGILMGDDPGGVYKTLGVGFVTNNLMGLIVTNYLSKETLNAITSKTAQALTVPLKLSSEILLNNSDKIYGSYQPQMQYQNINASGPVGWI